MSDASAPDNLQTNYAKQYKELKQLLLAKHFSGEYFTGLARFSFSSHPKCIMTDKSWTYTGQGVLEKVAVDGLEVHLYRWPAAQEICDPSKAE